MSDDGYTRITLRIPSDLHATLTDEAARTSKSMNAEIIGRLQASISEYAEERRQVSIARHQADWNKQKAIEELEEARAAVTASNYLLAWMSSKLPPEEQADPQVAEAKEMGDRLFRKVQYMLHQLAPQIAPAGSPPAKLITPRTMK